MFDESAREEYMKPGFEDAVSKEAKAKKSIDTDLDGEIYADQLHSLLQRVTPELNQMIAIDSLNKSRRANTEKAQETVKETRKLTDEEKVWNKIINIPDGDEPKSSPRQQIARQIPHHGGAFEGLVDGPKTFRQGYTFQMIRKPGGICETRKTVIDADGNTKTVVKRTVDGKTETTTVVNGLNANRLEAPKGDVGPSARNKMGVSCGRELNVTKDGYILPKNLWWLEVSASSSIVLVFVAVVVTFMCLSNIIEANRMSKYLTHHIIITKFSWKIIFANFHFEFDYGYDFR